MIYLVGRERRSKKAIFARNVDCRYVSPKLITILNMSERRKHLFGATEIVTVLKLSLIQVYFLFLVSIEFFSSLENFFRYLKKCFSSISRPILGSTGAVKASAAEKLKTDDGSVNGSAEPPHATAGHRGLNSPVDPSPTVSAEPTAKTTAVSYNAAVISSLSSEAASSPQPHTPTAQVPPIVQPVSAQSQVFFEFRHSILYPLEKV